MRCHHFDAGTCRSCTLLAMPRDAQVERSRARVEELLAPFAAPGGPVWSPPVLSADAGFRAKAKMVATGTAAEPVLGIATGVDLVDCPLYPPGVEELLEQVRWLIRRAQVPPYDVARRRGELKHVLVTISPEGELMLRLVLRSTAPLPRIREHLPTLLSRAPRLRVVSANIHPEHRAVLEGREEIHLVGDAALRMRTGDVTLRIRPQSFLQTNTEVAGALYRQVAAWMDEVGPASVWDLYCGVGGFALHCARTPGREVTGVELSAQAIEAAREAAEAEGIPATFHAADATTWAIAEAARSGPPEAVIVNPPRRGIGPELAGFLEDSGVRDVVYSSCHPTTLARDLAAMPSLQVAAGRLVDMFPHTEHEEVVVLLRRAAPDILAR
ncbi:23S rRNA (uracil(747)-C(5))-methyltransferase RlmC [Brachybacterium hainanense]|uniref:23S rRNA (Uracil(747)-C(5))-methyltransferase RlmC n=1 Tax=Brachybacterium hainanense TaxID=1541174 RepID=A0ABV6R675_9MICO